MTTQQPPTPRRRRPNKAKRFYDSMLSEVRQAFFYLTREAEPRYSMTMLSDPSVTGLHKNTLNRLHDATWVPTIETVERLEPLIGRARAKREGKTCPIERKAAYRRGRPKRRRKQNVVGPKEAAARTQREIALAAMTS